MCGPNKLGGPFSEVSDRNAWTHSSDGSTTVKDIKKVLVRTNESRLDMIARIDSGMDRHCPSAWNSGFRVDARRPKIAADPRRRGVHPSALHPPKRRFGAPSLGLFPRGAPGPFPKSAVHLVPGVGGGEGLPYYIGKKRARQVDWVQPQCDMCLARVIGPSWSTLIVGGHGKVNWIQTWQSPRNQTNKTPWARMQWHIAGWFLP